ncbi:MAG: hypothetical protein KDC44_24950 [Phaeodactylibacter sp.]|nr:hypothetical protein [Phaeodactylibacter sp.]
MKKMFALFFGITFLMSAQQTLAQDAKADRVVDAYFETIGGKDNWKKLDKMRLTGKSVTQGMELTTTVESMRPNMQKVVVAFQDKQFVEAFDGTNAWTINPFMGSMEPQPKTEEETKEAAENMFEDELLNYAEKGHTLTYEGQEEVEGTQADVLKLVRKSGDEVYYYMDAEVHIPIMVKSFAKSGPMKGQPVEVFFSGYEEVEIPNGGGAVIMAHVIEQRMNGVSMMTMTADKVELNPDDISETTFALPADED